MKRLLLVGIVGCGGGEALPAGDEALPATPNDSQTKVNEPPAQVADIDPVAELENRGAKITRNDNGDVGARRYTSCRAFQKSGNHASLASVVRANSRPNHELPI
ncbi:MAG: hypothetical protein VX346_09960 [Planctomycetota bacterium]|nr:hypothetical protein [Planctomycetota bacterium]